VRPELGVAVPSLMASQPTPELAASAMNALAHAVEALYTPMASEVSERPALWAVGLIGVALEDDEPLRDDLALGALWAGYASGLAGFALHHAVCQTIVRVAGTPHAQTNAVMLPHIVRLMEIRAPRALRLVAEELDAGEGTARDAAPRVAALAARSGVARLSELAFPADAVDPVVAAALEHPALGNTPGQVSEAELRAVLEAAL
jgi:maleylacetate reductase